MKTRTFLAIAAAGAAAITPCAAATGGPDSPVRAGRQERIFSSTWDGSLQPYQLFVPPVLLRNPPQGGAPLVVVLHGKGVDQNAWFNFTPILAEAEKRGYVVAAPYGRGDMWYRGPGERDVLDVAADVQKTVNINADRVFLTGHSMGGWGTFWVGLRNPEVFSAIAPMSGWAPMDLLPNARLVPPLMIHDETDEIVPVGNFRAAARELARLGVSFQYREEYGNGHGSKLIGDNLGRVFEWFDAHPRQLNPVRFAAAARSPRSVMERAVIRRLADATRAGVVDVAFPTSATVTATTSGVLELTLLLPEGVTTATVDGQRFRPFGGGMVAVSRPDVSARWEDARSATRREPATDPRLEWNDAASTAPVRMLDRVAGILCGATGAEVCLMNTDSVLDPGTEFRSEQVLDVFLYPEEGLATFDIRGEDLAAVLRATRARPLRDVEVLPKPPAAGKTVRVVAPVMLARDFEASATVRALPHPVAKYLLDATRPVAEPAQAGTPRRAGNRPVLPRLMALENSRARGTTATVDSIMLHFSSDCIQSPGNPFDVNRVIAVFHKYGVSAHYLVDRQGNIYQLVDEDRAAYHAGKGRMPAGEPRTDRGNDFSIGIEILATGSEKDMKPFFKPGKYEEFRKFAPHAVGYTDAQYAALTDLIADIRTRHPAIMPDRDHIIGHDEYAPGRKTDPGELFDWRRIGLPKARKGPTGR